MKCRTVTFERKTQKSRFIDISSTSVSVDASRCDDDVCTACNPLSQEEYHQNKNMREIDNFSIVFYCLVISLYNICIALQSSKAGTKQKCTFGNQNETRMLSFCLFRWPKNDFYSLPCRGDGMRRSWLSHWNAGREKWYLKIKTRTSASFIWWLLLLLWNLNTYILFIPLDGRKTEHDTDIMCWFWCKYVCNVISSSVQHPKSDSTHLLVCLSSFCSWYIRDVAETCTTARARALAMSCHEINTQLHTVTDRQTAQRMYSCIFADEKKREPKHATTKLY